MYSYGARFYDTQIGRFISADSIVPRPGDPQALNRFSYARNSPITRVDPSGHGDCNVHTTAGCLPWNVDPVFGGTDFLGSLKTVNPSNSFNAYDPFGIGTYFVPSAAMNFSVPSQYVAAALNYENEPGKLPMGAVSRVGKQLINPSLQEIDPMHRLFGQPDVLGYSQGLGNTKPGRARETENYYLTNYDPESPQYKMASILRYGNDAGLHPEQQAYLAAYYVAANIRIGIDAYYGQGYSGPISEEGAVRVIGYHNAPGWYVFNNTPAPPGAYGVALLVDVSENNKGLPFLR